MARRSVGWAMAVLLVAGCGSGAGDRPGPGRPLATTSPPGPPDSAAVPPASPADTGEQAEVRRVLDRYLDATNGGNARALASLYAEDAVLLPPDHEAVAGRSAIEAYWAEGLEPGLQIRAVRVEAAAGRGWVVGRYVLPATADQSADYGKCVMTLVRGRDGTWRLTADIWNDDHPSVGGDDDGQDGRGAPRHPVS